MGIVEENRIWVHYGPRQRSTACPQNAPVRGQDHPRTAYKSVASSVTNNIVKTGGCSSGQCTRSTSTSSSSTTSTAPAMPIVSAIPVGREVYAEAAMSANGVTGSVSLWPEYKIHRLVL